MLYSSIWSHSRPVTFNGSNKFLTSRAKPICIFRLPIVRFTLTEHLYGNMQTDGLGENAYKISSGIYVVASS